MQIMNDHSLDTMRHQFPNPMQQNPSSEANKRGQHVQLRQLKSIFIIVSTTTRTGTFPEPHESTARNRIQFP
jgi:hypothetical protein